MGWRVMGNRMFASPLRSGNGGTFNAILATRPKIRRGEEMRWTAKGSLARVLHQEDHHMKNVMDEPCVDNCLGLDLAGLSTKLAAVEAIVTSQQEELRLQREQATSQQEELRLQREQATSQQKELRLQRELATSQQEELNGLTKEVTSLWIPAQGYLLVRNRVISNFRRHILKKRRKSDGKIIDAGNLAAHQSDVLGDAMLYVSLPGGWGRGPKRNDPETFKALYGLEPKLASKIKHEKTVKVLNAHAGIILSNPESVTEKLPESLEKIVKLLERFGGDEGCSDELRDACRSFWHDGEHGSIEED